MSLKHLGRAVGFHFLMLYITLFRDCVLLEPLLPEVALLQVVRRGRLAVHAYRVLPSPPPSAQAKQGCDVLTLCVTLPPSSTLSNGENHES